MRNAYGHQCEVEISGSEKKNMLTRTRTTFPPYNVYLGSFWKFHVSSQNNGKEMHKTSVLHAQSCFLAN